MTASRIYNHRIRCLSEKPLFELDINMDTLLMSLLWLHNVIFGKYFQKILNLSRLSGSNFVLLGLASQVVEKMGVCYPTWLLIILEK